MPRGIGILPLRHNEYDREYDLDLRAGIIAVSITGRNDAGEFGLGHWKYDPASAGDVTQAHFWPKNTRPVGGWSWCWPAVLIGSKSGATPTLQGKGGRPSVATGAKSKCGTFSPGSYQMLPCIGEEYAPDKRFSPLTPELPKDEDGKPLWKPHAGAFGIALAATNEERQVNYFMPTDSRLVAVNAAGDPKMGSLVCDLGDDFRVDPKRTQHLQSAFRVVKEPLGGKNVISLQLGPSGCGDTSGGWFYDRDIVARGSRTNGGPFDVGGENDIHRIGKDADGHPVNMLHIGTNALFRKNAAEDGPIRFEDVYHDGKEYSHYVRCHLSWTGADWAIWTSSPFTGVPSRPGIPTPVTGTRPAISTLTGGSTGAGNLSRPNVASVDVRANAKTLLNNVVGFVGAITQLAGSGMLAWPQNHTPGLPNDSGDVRPPVASVDKAEKERPITGQMTAFAGQGGSVASGGSGPSTRTGAKGDPYVYTQAPGQSKFPCGTGPGGWCILPPEVSMSDAADGYVPPNITTSTTFFGVGPGAYFYAGLPELANGAIKSGYSWGVDTSTGDLLFRQHGVNTTPTSAMRFTSSGNISWYSGTSSQGIFDHSNTSNRTYTYPDVTGVVVVSLATHTLGGGAAATLGTIGGSGPTTAAQSRWEQIKCSDGTTRWVPTWV